MPPPIPAPADGQDGQPAPVARLSVRLRLPGRASVRLDPAASGLDVIVLGAADAVDVWLPGAADRHARLERTGAGWLLTPLSEVLDPGGTPIVARPLVAGDRLRLGPWEVLATDATQSDRLELLTGPIDDLVLPIPPGGGEIGRDAECPLRVDLPGTSRRHAVVTGAAPVWHVDDLGSTNGTFLNGDPVRQPARLRHGDRLVVGRTVFTCCAAAADLVGRLLPTPAGPVRIQGLAGHGTAGSTWRGRAADGRLLAVRISDTGTAMAVRPWRVGGNLAETVIAGGPLPVDRLLGLARDLCRAVHASTTPHPGLRPGNVLAVADGWEIVDAGVSVGFDPTSPVDGPDPRWISPETSTGAPIDSASNVFSLGLLLYYAATGHPPFVGLTRAELAVVRQAGSLPRPDTLNRSLPSAVAKLIAHLLIRDPAERPSAATALTMIAAVRAGQAIEAVRPGASVIGAQDGSVRIARLSASLRRSSSRLAKVMQRRRTLAAAAVLAVLMAGALVWTGRSLAAAPAVDSSVAAHPQQVQPTAPASPADHVAPAAATSPTTANRDLARQIPPAILAGRHRDVLDRITAYVESAHPGRLEPAWEQAMRGAWRATEAAGGPTADRERWLAAASRVGLDLAGEADPPPPPDITLVAGEPPAPRVTVLVDALLGGPGDDLFTRIHRSGDDVVADGLGGGLRYGADLRGTPCPGGTGAIVYPRTLIEDPVNGQRIAQDGGDSPAPLLVGGSWSLWAHRDEDDRIQPLGLWPMPEGRIGARWSVDGPGTVLASAPSEGQPATWGDCQGPALFYAIIDPSSGTIIATRWIDAGPAPQVVDAWGRMWLATLPGGRPGLTVIAADLTHDEASIPLGTPQGDGRFLAMAVHGRQLVLAGQARHANQRHGVQPAPGGGHDGWMVILAAELHP
jgi:hypothetical protein